MLARDERAGREGSANGTSGGRVERLEPVEGMLPRLQWVGLRAGRRASIGCHTCHRSTWYKSPWMGQWREFVILPQGAHVTHLSSRQYDTEGEGRGCGWELRPIHGVACERSLER